jgi:hypothetical protein
MSDIEIENDSVTERWIRDELLPTPISRTTDERWVGQILTVGELRRALYGVNHNAIVVVGRYGIHNWDHVVSVAITNGGEAVFIEDQKLQRKPL